MSENYIANPDRHLSKEEDSYGTDVFGRDVYALYSQGEIDFALPNELLKQTVFKKASHIISCRSKSLTSRL